MKGLKQGIKVESEHKNTVNFIKKFYSQHHTLPSNKLIYSSIAKDHLKETPSYYTKLKKAKL